MIFPKPAKGLLDDPCKPDIFTMTYESVENDCLECKGSGVDPNLMLASNPPQPARCGKCGGSGKTDAPSPFVQGTVVGWFKEDAALSESVPAELAARFGLRHGNIQAERDALAERLKALNVAVSSAERYLTASHNNSVAVTSAKQLLRSALEADRAAVAALGGDK